MEGPDNRLSRIWGQAVSAPPTVVQGVGARPPSRLSDRRDRATTDPLRTPRNGAVGLTRSSYRQPRLAPPYAEYNRRQSNIVTPRWEVADSSCTLPPRPRLT
ncbi:uncharacterized protein MEPE_04320 [Melanopsichium pennsylvanicum]|uniref:Uncharacterized protein n=1 Tax=Melanopsichium pennsylvanicum TaxID=63383 RepID=A0AAJ4XPL0_9BASI|nr:uncharacterized protein MEPE_04320 [Melanopsichium pennsylvanicum]